MNISVYRTGGFVVVALIVGIAVGYSFTPEYRTSMYENESMDLGRADRLLDLRYINAMIAHHRGAMLLAEQLQQESNRPEMQALAADILANEPQLIDELYGWKRDWYGDIKPVQDPVVANLGPRGETFDLRFLNAMIAHHRAGIDMAQDARMKSSRAEILDNADAVEAFLSGGVEALTELRRSWYNI